MNQILVTNFKKRKTDFKKFIFILILSILSLLILIVKYLLKNENEISLSKNISDNYKIFRLYSNSINHSNKIDDDEILGTISIPKINANFPFFSGISDDLLKIAPCRFFGDMPNRSHNLCIAGHNYNDDRFFSKLFNLDLGDEIVIEDNLQNKSFYHVFDKYEVAEDSISTAIENKSNDFELTLVTCNNLNNKRLIIKAQKKA